MSVDTPDEGAGPTAPDSVDIDRIERLLGEAALGRDDHENAPAVVIDRDAVASALGTLREEAGFDHCACVTAQHYRDRYETIYHLRSYDDPTRELSVVVPTPREDPRSESATSVYRTANFHEREAYDLVGIEYEDHPDPRRILLPETWQGHPLGPDYDQTEPQVVPLREHVNPIAEDHTEGDTLFLNIGPHHPATHGVLHVKTVLDGEEIVDVDPDIGYLHRCEEQMCQQSAYRYEIMPYPDRWDYAPGGILNEWAYARTIEDLADVEVPEYAQLLRTMSAELTRMASHLLAVGTFGLDVYGDFTAIFMYAVRDRERIQSLLEALTGQRLMFNYLRVGGVAFDVPDPREEFFADVRSFIDGFPDAIEEYHDLITGNEIFQMRCIDTGVLPPDLARSMGATGPVARGSGIDYDLRRDDPYGIYPELDWDVITQDAGDNYARVLVRLQELEESAKIVEQCVDRLEDYPEDDRQIQSNVPRTIKPDPDAEIYRAVEAAKGELGIYIRSDGTETPARFKIRSPCFSNLQTLPVMAEGEFVADMIASLGSLDVVLGEVDR
ncbi:MAG: NADH-quinone oxidoreductase subunit D [Halococcoides sp.]